MMDYDSITNQRIKEKFVNREVYACVTPIVEYILQQDDPDAPFTIEDIENSYVNVCPECGEQIPDIDELETVYDEEEEEELYICPHCGERFDYPDQESQDVYEWWIVSSFLGEKLKAQGEIVISDGLNYIWGRQCTGQAISLDYVISKICEEIEILEGQKYEWKV